MAYMSQQQKKELAPAINAVLKKYGMKGSIAVKHLSTLVVNIREGKLDLIAAANAHNMRACRQGGGPFYPVADHFQEHGYRVDEYYTGEVQDFFLELRDAMMRGNHNNSEPMTDYFDVGWYMNINVGQYDKPYKLLD